MFFIQNLANESLKYVKILKKNFCYFSSPPSAVPQIFRQRRAPFAPFPPRPHVPARLAENENYGRQPNGARGKRNFPRAGPRHESGKAAVHIISKKTGAIFRFPETHARGIKIGENPQTWGFKPPALLVALFFARGLLAEDFCGGYLRERHRLFERLGKRKRFFIRASARSRGNLFRFERGERFYLRRKGLFGFICGSRGRGTAPFPPLRSRSQAPAPLFHVL